VGHFCSEERLFPSQETLIHQRGWQWIRNTCRAGTDLLNTAALGPTPKTVLDQVMKAWYELESNPVMMAYVDGAVHVATDHAREQIAGLMNCTADELLITRSATEGMNSVALGINLDRGDRVLTTNVEHEGGSICWNY
jgi:selenocysteine lyase/cysteine desulfurase